MSDSVGKISLDVELQSDLSKQINQFAGKLGEQLKASIQNIGGFDFSKMTGSISDTLKSTMDKALSGINLSIENVFNNAGDTVSAVINVAKENALAAIAEIKKSAAEAMEGLRAMSKKIKIPMNLPSPTNAATPNSIPAINPVMPRAPPISIPSVNIPKIDTGINIDALKAQIDNLSQSLDITNAKIEQQKEKLASLRAAYDNTFNLSKKNKLQEQILNTEAIINKLVSTSDKTGFKLADLDKHFTFLTNSAKQATAGVSAVNNKIKETSTAATKSSGQLRNLGKSAKETGNNFHGMHSGLKTVMRQFLTWMVVLPLVMKGITAITTFIGQSLIANTQFANSLAQIKSNLYTAFIPIYQAALPAINSLMAGLSRVTAYLASFTNALFGKTYQSSLHAAKGLVAAKTAMGAYGSAAKKAGQEAKGALMGFDEVNQLDLNKSSDNSEAPELAMPSMDTSILEQSTNGWADKFKAVLGTVFEPFKNSWVKDGAGVVSEFEYSINGTKEILGSFFDVLKTPSMQLFIENISALALAIVGLGLRIYDGFILPVLDWFLNLLPGAAVGLNPILEAVTRFVNYLSGDGFNYVTLFLSAVIGLVAGIATFNIIQTVITWFTNMKSAVSGVWAIMTANPIVLVIAIIAGLIAAFVALYASNENFKNKVNEIGNTLKNFFQPILESVKTVLLDVWNNALVPLGKALIDLGQMIIKPLAGILKDVLVIAFGVVINVAKDLWSNVIVPLGTFLKDVFVNIIQSVIDIYYAWKAAIQTVIDVIMWLWQNVLVPIIEFLSGSFISVFKTVTEGIKSNIGTMKVLFSGLLDFITGVFTGDWGKAWNGVTETFKGIVNLISSIFKGVLNTTIDIINSAIRGVVGSINGLIQGAISQLNKLPGVNLSINPISTPQIPKLARGGIIDQPTLAMVGEAGKEAVVPLENNTEWMDRITELVTNALITALQMSSINNSSSSQDVKDIILQLDGTTLGRILYPYLNREDSRVGTPIIVGA